MSETVPLENLDITSAELPDDSPTVVVPQLDESPDTTFDSDVQPDQSDSQLSAAERVRRRIKEGPQSRSGKRGDKSGGAAQTTPRAAVPPKPRAGTLVKPLTRLYVSIGTMVFPFDAVCGRAIMENAEACAKSLEALAQENEAVRRAIIALTQTSAWGGLLIAHMPILLMVVVHHAPKEISTSLAPLASMMNDPHAFDDIEPDEAEDPSAA